MKQYVDLVTRIIREGSESDDRTGTGTIKIFGHQSVYNMDDGFPLLTFSASLSMNFVSSISRIPAIVGI